MRRNLKMKDNPNSLVKYTYTIHLTKPLVYYSLPIGLVKENDTQYRLEHLKRGVDDSLDILGSVIKQLEMSVDYIEQVIEINKLYYLEE